MPLSMMYVIGEWVGFRWRGVPLRILFQCVLREGLLIGCAPTMHSTDAQISGQKAVGGECATWQMESGQMDIVIGYRGWISIRSDSNERFRAMYLYRSVC